MKTKKLSNEQIIEICDKVIENVKDCQKNGGLAFLCNQLSNIIGYEEDITYHIPEFTYENAYIHANANNNYINCFPHSNICWFNDGNEQNNYINRIKFMEWIKSQYQNKQDENN